MDPELRKIQSDELIVYDVELSEYIQRKINRIQVEKVDAVLTDSDIQKIYQALSDANIIDPRILSENVEKAGSVGKRDR